MEPARPHVDAYVLNLLRSRTFAAKDFFETREGGCRLSAPLSQELAKTMPAWGALVAPYAEMVARQVAIFAKNNNAFGALRLQGTEPRARVKVRAKPIATPPSPKAAKSIPVASFANACRNCGATLAIRKRVYCDDCLPNELERIRKEATPAFQGAGPAKLVQMRARGIDPTQSKAAQQRRSATAMQQRRAVVAWKDDGSLRGIDFARDIFSKIQDLPVRVLAEAMASSLSHASKVRTGRLIPHKRHWNALLSLQIL